MTNVGAGLAKLGVGAGTVVCIWASNHVEYWLVSYKAIAAIYNILSHFENDAQFLKVCLAVWELGGTILQINCLTNTERLLEQLKETSASHLVCDSFNIEQGLNLRQQLESLKQIIQVGESEGHEDVVTVKSLMDAEANTRIGGGKFDWDMAPICLMFTTRNGESKIVKHTNKSLTAQVFSPKGASNNWFDQVFVRLFFKHSI